MIDKEGVMFLLLKIASDVPLSKHLIKLHIDTRSFHISPENNIRRTIQFVNAYIENDYSKDAFYTNVFYGYWKNILDELHDFLYDKRVEKSASLFLFSEVQL